MAPKPPAPHLPLDGQAPALALKMALCLWMAAVMFVFIVLFFPAELLPSFGQIDLRGWVLYLRVSIQPFFTD